MDVSENSGTPKSSILIGFSIINHPFWDLNTRDLPIEFAIVSFAGADRARTLEGQLTTFIGDCRHRGLPFVGYCITRERVGLGGKSDAVATHGINFFIDDTDYIVNEIRRTRHRCIFTTPSSSVILGSSSERDTVT